MIYLLDTDALVFMIRGLKSARRPAREQAARTRAPIDRGRVTMRLDAFVA